MAVPDDKVFDTKAFETARALAAGSATAIRWTKHALNNWLRLAGPNFDTSLALEFLGFRLSRRARGTGGCARQAAGRISRARSPSGRGADAATGLPTSTDAEPVLGLGAPRGTRGPAARAPARRRCSMPTPTIPATGAASMRAAFVPTICDRSQIWPASPSPPRRICARPIPSVSLPCRWIGWRACTPLRAPPASPRWSAIRKTISPPGAISWPARSARRAAGAGMRVHVGLRLRPVHRRPGRALRRGGGGLHGDSDVGRADRAAGATHRRLQARYHHDHAELHARHPR